MSAWITSTSYINLAASSSSNILSSIYGSQVSQIIISPSRNEHEEVSFSRRDLVKKSSMRPRSAMTSARSGDSYSAVMSGRKEKEDILNSMVPPPPSRCHHLSETMNTPRQASLSSSCLLLDERKTSHDWSGSQIKRLTRPKSSFPQCRSVNSQNHASIKSRRPKTANVTMSNDCDNHSSISKAPPPPILSRPTTPVVLSSTPQYFDFWNEKPLKPREWSRQQFARKKWTRPKSSTVHRGYLSSRSKGSCGSDQQSSSITGGSSIIDNHHIVEGTRDQGSLYANGKVDSELGPYYDDENRRYSKTNEDRNVLHREGHDSKLTSSTDGKDDSEGNYSLQKTLPSGSNDENTTDCDQSIRRLPKHDQVNSKSDFREENETTTKQEEMKRENEAKFNQLYDMVDGNLKAHSVTTSWLLSSGSTLTTRFELPVDMKSLENMTPMEYLVLHCKLSNQKKNHYSKIFKKVCKQVNMTSQEVIIGIFHALHEIVPIKDAEAVCKDLKLISSDSLISNVQFSCICAVAERLYGKHYLPFEPFKEMIEVVDFEALAWKLRGCSITSDLQTLLFKLSS